MQKAEGRGLSRRVPNLFGSLALGWCGFGGSVGAAEVSFDRYELATGQRRETVLTGAFLPGPLANIATVGTNENGGRRLRIFAFVDGAWNPAVEATLRPGTLFVDVAAMGGRDRLLTCERGRLNWFDPGSGTERLLVALETDYRAGEAGGVAAIDITADLNGDGRDDLLLPDTDGFWIALQLHDGAFAAPRKLGPPDPYSSAVALGATRTYAEDGITATNMPWYLRRVYQADYNHDGRDDLVFWNQRRFNVYFQDEQGRFEGTARSFAVDVPVDADGAYSLMFEYTDENMLGLLLGLRKKTQLTMLHALQDLNADGIADVVTVALTGRRLGNHRSTYQAYFGAATPEGTAFAAEPTTAIRPRGAAGALQASGYSKATLRDFNGDGATDVFFADVSVGFGGMLRAMAGRSVALNVEFYALADGAFPRRPTGKLRVRPRLYPFGEGVFFPPVLIGDVSGDGHAELVVGHGRDELRIYAGHPTKPWTSQPQQIAVALPDDERNTSLADLDGDGKQDILVYNTSQTPHLLTTLIAQDAAG